MLLYLLTVFMTLFQAVEPLQQAYCAEIAPDVPRPSTPTSEADLARNPVEIDRDPRINLVAPGQ
jgi:hypothetical protein